MSASCGGCGSWPEVRRLADWSKGAFTPTSLIQVAPLAVTMIAGLGLIRHYRVLAQRRGIPILLMLFEPRMPTSSGSCRAA